MFTSLHALAKQATLMITIAAEGDDQLRVNVTPAPLDGKAKAGLPQALSLVATPAEFDSDFFAALSTWHAPKRSLIEQAQAASSPPAGAPALPAPKAESKLEKPARKGAKSKAAEQQAAAPDEPNAGDGAVTANDVPPVEDEATPAPDAAPAVSDGAEAASAAAPAADEPADKFTLDLF